MGRRRLVGLIVAWGFLACHTPEASPILWEPTLEASLARAKAEHKPAMVDFTAGWCAGCQALETRTYNQPTVQRAAARFVPIKIDATHLDEAMQKTFDRFAVASLPMVVFVDSNGVVLQAPRVAGFVEAPHFVEMLAQVR